MLEEGWAGTARNHKSHIGTIKQHFATHRPFLKFTNTTFCLVHLLLTIYIVVEKVTFK